MSVVETLRRWETFSHLAPGRSFERLAAHVSPTTYPAGVAVVHQGDATRDAYFIARGAVRIQRDTPYGVFALAYLGAGDLFGETAFVDRQGRSETR